MREILAPLFSAGNLQSGKYAFLFDLVLKRNGRLCTKLDLNVGLVTCIY
jgi:hypothetical protein